MKLRLATACVLASFALAGSAFAETQITAKLEAPKPAKIKLIAAHAVFTCQDTVCAAGVAPDDAYTVSSCKELAKKVGRLTAYGNDRHTLTAEQLNTCNVAAGPSTATSASASN